ncbi:hypothetical protein B0J14DRAFT_565584 [Halenospora varia]|nr:hypothetical protein B0J14DRAFT_565584 [Halenospora varia]
MADDVQEGGVPSSSQGLAMSAPTPEAQGVSPPSTSAPSCPVPVAYYTGHGSSCPSFKWPTRNQIPSPTRPGNSRSFPSQPAEPYIQGTELVISHVGFLSASPRLTVKTPLVRYLLLVTPRPSESGRCLNQNPNTFLLVVHNSFEISILEMCHHAKKPNSTPRTPYFPRALPFIPAKLSRARFLERINVVDVKKYNLAWSATTRIVDLFNRPLANIADLYAFLLPTYVGIGSLLK